MRWLAPFALVLAIIVVALTVGCGGGNEAAAGNDDATTEAEAAVETTDADADADEASEIDRAAAFACTDTMTPIVDDLLEVDGRLDVGLTNADLRGYVGDVGAEYAAIDFASLSPSCVADVGVPAEQAYNTYNRSLGVWDECLDDFDCETESIEPRLQRMWAQASNQVQKARDGLRAQG